MMICRRIYGRTIDAQGRRLVFESKDKVTGLPRYQEFAIDPRFCEVELLGPKPPLSPEAYGEILSNPLDVATWMRHLPPERFAFRGFSFTRSRDVTEAEVIADIKQLLIDRESISAPAKFAALEERLRVLLQRPTLRLGLSALTGHGNVMRITGNASLHREMLRAVDAADDADGFARSLFGRAFNRSGITVYNDVASLASSGCCIDQEIVSRGTRDLVVAPLSYTGQPLGLVELWSPEPLGLNELQATILNDVLPLLSLATKRTVDELYALTITPTI